MNVLGNTEIASARKMRFSSGSASDIGPLAMEVSEPTIRNARFAADADFTDARIGVAIN